MNENRRVPRDEPQYPHLKFSLSGQGELISFSLSFFGNLSSQTELGNDSAVAFDVVLLEVAEEVPSVTDHLIQTAAAVVVLLVQLQVLGKCVDAEGQDSDLYFRRTGVAFVNLVLFDKSLLLFLGNHFLHLW